MKQTLFLTGPSDIKGKNRSKIIRHENGKTRRYTEYYGVLPILPFVMSDSTLNEKSTSVLIGKHKKLRVAGNARLNIFNLVGDADASATSLNIIQSLAYKLKPSRYFNQPVNVFRTARKTLPGTLSGIPGCRVPRVMSSDPASYGELETACDEFNAWPLIIRARGYHAGENMVLVQDKSQLATISNCPWLYAGVLLIEYVDYRNREDLYQKTRIIFVEGIPYPRHSIISDRCFIHANSRVDLMDKEPELRREEERFLAYLGENGLNGEYGKVFAAIQERIGLDVFGVDFALVDGMVVVFEANACMNFLSQDHGKDGRYLYLDKYVSDLKRGVKRMLMKA